jgi:carboxyl-terminal processing protease
MTKRIYSTLAFILSLTAAFLLGYAARTYTSSQVHFSILSEAFDILKNNGYNPLPEGSTLEYGMVRGMLQAYGDPYSVFLEPVATELEGNSLQGSFGGIGVRLGTDADGNYILYPFPDSPALKSGIVEGDRLVSVDNLAVTPQTSTEDIQASIRGPVGTKVEIVIARPPDLAQQTISVERAEIPLPSVTFHLDPNQPLAGVIEVNIIADSTPGEIEKAVLDLQSRGATHFILDLRNNGGGLLNAGIDVARLFLEDGVVIEQQYKGRAVDTFEVKTPGSLSDIPMVVLINENTASAAEIIAGALQAHERARLVGFPSYGKDTIQLVFALKDKSSIHITAAHWWIPDLEFPKDGRGLVPDVQLPPDAADPQQAVQVALGLLFP